MNMQNPRNFMHRWTEGQAVAAADAQQLERRGAIMRILRDGLVRRQADLVRLLRKAGHDVTQSSISRDLRDLGVLKASGRYVLPPDDASQADNNLATVAQFVRGLRTAGDCLTIVRTATGAAQSVAVAIDRAHWPEVAGTLSGDDTIFVATAGAREQEELLRRLQAIFKV
jgi:transcriptional regulator of arginine metabolism